jgi:hypothetical protein
VCAGGFAVILEDVNALCSHFPVYFTFRKGAV